MLPFRWEGCHLLFRCSQLHPSLQNSKMARNDKIELGVIRLKTLTQDIRELLATGDDVLLAAIHPQKTTRK